MKNGNKTETNNDTARKIEALFKLLPWLPAFIKKQPISDQCVGFQRLTIKAFDLDVCELSTDYPRKTRFMRSVFVFSKDGDCLGRIGATMSYRRSPLCLIWPKKEIEFDEMVIDGMQRLQSEKNVPIHYLIGLLWEDNRPRLAVSRVPQDWMEKYTQWNNEAFAEAEIAVEKELV